MTNVFPVNNETIDILFVSVELRPDVSPNQMEKYSDINNPSTSLYILFLFILWCLHVNRLLHSLKAFSAKLSLLYFTGIYFTSSALLSR